MNAPEAEFELLSVAVHETVVGPSGNVDPDEGVHTGVTEPSTMSVAVAENETTWFPDVMFEGRFSAGAVVSSTATVMITVVVPTLFVAEQVTLVSPIGYVAPDSWSQLAPEALNVTTAPAGDVASTMSTSGRVKLGGDAGFETTTEKVPVVAPKALDAEQVTVVVPYGKNDPEAWSQLAPPASNVTYAPPVVFASETTTSGNDNWGGPLIDRSTTENVTGPMVRIGCATSVAFTVTE